MITLKLVFEIILFLISIRIVILFWSYYKSLEYYSKFFYSKDIIQTLMIIYKEDLSKESYIISQSKEWEKTNYGKDGFEEMTILRMDKEYRKSFISKRNTFGFLFLIILVICFFLNIVLLFCVLPLFTILYFFKPLRITENMVTNCWIETLKLLIYFKNNNKEGFGKFCNNNQQFYIFKDLL